MNKCAAGTARSVHASALPKPRAHEEEEAELGPVDAVVAASQAEVFHLSAYGINRSPELHLKIGGLHAKECVALLLAAS